MGLVICLVVGMFAGWLVAAIQEVDEGILARMGIGLLGGLIGNLSVGVIDNAAMAGMTDFSWISALFSVVGAFMLLGLASKSSSINYFRSRPQ